MLLPACAFFELPDPPEPVGEEEKVAAYSPEEVLAKISEALGLYHSLSMYSQQLDDGFTFYPYEGLPTSSPWGKETEKSVVSEILMGLDYSISQPSKVDFVLNSLQRFPDSAFARVSYSMVFVLRAEGTFNLYGYSDVVFKRLSDGVWVITLWRDFKDTAMSWGEFKMRYR